MTHPSTVESTPGLTPPQPLGQFVEEGRLLRSVEGYLPPRDVEHVQAALTYARELVIARPPEPAPAVAAKPTPRQGSTAGQWDIGYALGVAETLADAI
ncbi:MAG TPA: hypothetical protein VGK33_20175, partial [Chloroflexota bacterium]